MGRDSVQCFLRFTGDVHILRREPRVSRKYRIPVLPCLLTSLPGIPLSRAWVLVVFLGMPRESVRGLFSKNCHIPESLWAWIMVFATCECWLI